MRGRETSRERERERRGGGGGGRGGGGQEGGGGRRGGGEGGQEREREREREIKRERERGRESKYLQKDTCVCLQHALCSIDSFGNCFTMHEQTFCCEVHGTQIEDLPAHMISPFPGVSRKRKCPRTGEVAGDYATCATRSPGKNMVCGLIVCALLLAKDASKKKRLRLGNGFSRAGHADNRSHDGFFCKEIVVLEGTVFTSLREASSVSPSIHSLCRTLQKVWLRRNHLVMMDVAWALGETLTSVASSR